MSALTVVAPSHYPLTSLRATLQTGSIPAPAVEHPFRERNCSWHFGSYYVAHLVPNRQCSETRGPLGQQLGACANAPFSL